MNRYISPATILNVMQLQLSLQQESTVGTIVLSTWFSLCESKASSRKICKILHTKGLPPFQAE